MSTSPADDTPTVGHTLTDLALAQARQDLADQPNTPTPVLLSHAVTGLVGIALVGVNSAVWDLVPGGLAAVLTFVSIILQAGFTALAAHWAHTRSRPIPRGTSGAHEA